MRPVRLVVAVLIVLAAAAAGLGAWCATHDAIAVCVTNDSQLELRDAILEVHGGGTNRKEFLGEIAPGQVRCFELHTKAEADVSLVFTDRSGASHRHIVVGYFEGGYSGKSIVTVAPNLEIEAKEEIAPDCFMARVKSK
jgi:hypothetical protein